METRWQSILFEALPVDEVLDRELEMIVRQEAKFVYGVAYAVLRNHHDAEDSAQETFVRVMRYRHRLPEVSDRRAWLARIAWRVAIDRRKAANVISLDEAAESVLNLYAAGEGVEQIASHNQMKVLLGQMIASLPRKLREAVTLSLNEDLSQNDIGQVLGIPESSVRTRLFRARQLLRQKLATVLGGKDEKS
jgi:RNA polymerase sigma-70 factor (ECF subfamily)